MAFFDLIPPLLMQPFFIMALLGAFGASIAGGVIGSYVVVKRIVFIGGSISHAVIGGLGAAIYLKRVHGVSWLEPIHGALFAAFISAALMAMIRQHYRQREDSAIAALWAIGMSVGVILISLTPGYTSEITNYLFGNILWASRSDLLLLFGLDGVILLVTWIYHRRFLALCFDETQAALQGENVNLLYLLLLSLIALTVVIMIQVVGAILLIAFLALPAAIANTFTHRMSKMMGLAVIIGGASSILGIGASFVLNWPSGSTIALTVSLFYLLNLLRKKP